MAVVATAAAADCRLLAHCQQVELCILSFSCGCGSICGSRSRESASNKQEPSFFVTDVCGGRIYRLLRIGRSEPCPSAPIPTHCHSDDHATHGTNKRKAQIDAGHRRRTEGEIGRYAGPSTLRRLGKENIGLYRRRGSKRTRSRDRE